MHHGKWMYNDKGGVLNMIYSMTAFARKEKQTEWGHATWELRSVNHRYLEVSFCLPESLNYLEPLIRHQLSQHVRRGKLDVRLRYKPPDNKALSVEVEEDLAKAMIKAYAKLARLARSSHPLNPNELLRWPQLLKLPDMAYASLEPDLMTLFSETLVELCLIRAREGKAIFELIRRRVTRLQVLIDSMQKQLAPWLDLQQKKIRTRLSDLTTGLGLDPNRLEQEVLLFTQKTDVAEELDRLQIHLNEFGRLLEQDLVQGKQLDFLLQELNREANTLASKSLSAELSLMAVNIKVVIEEMREQVQNVE